MRATFRIDILEFYTWVLGLGSWVLGLGLVNAFAR
jgi:hypothetical protein